MRFPRVGLGISIGEGMETPESWWRQECAEDGNTGGCACGRLGHGPWSPVTGLAYVSTAHWKAN